MVLIIVLLLFTYNISGIYSVFFLILSLINILISTIFMAFNPNSYSLRIIRLLSVFIFIHVIFTQINILLSNFI